ncbi:alpha-tocopherol transfer protein-like [Brevipalpus obovatus]|uniref:alpha-tocopherol transfer protein-like n=1 Tax=Brevipalpus obovatus TaxID=246614 RepID=UPI003D9F9EB4
METHWIDNVHQSALKNINHLRKMIEMDMKYVSPDEKSLLKFLIANDGQPDKAFQAVKNFISSMDRNPEIFRWSDGVYRATMSESFCYSSHRGYNGELILLIRIKKWYPGEVGVEDLLRMSLFMVETSLLDEEVQRNGCVAIIDAEGISWTQFYQFGLSNVKLVSHFIDQCLPIKIKKIHILNENRIVSFVYGMVEKFISHRLKSLIHFHGHDYQSIVDLYPGDCLPKYLGGNKENPDIQHIYEHMERNKDTVIATWRSFKSHHIDLQVF